MRPFALSGKPEPNRAMPLYGSPVPGTIEPSAGLIWGAFFGSNRLGRNVEVFPSWL